DVLACADTEADPRVNRARCRELHIRSMVVVPLVHLGHIAGVLKVVAGRTAAFAQREVDALRLMAGLLAGALNHAVEFDAKKRLLAERAAALDALRVANDHLRESEAKYRGIVQHAVDAVFIVDRDFRFLDANDQACRSLGYTRDELLSMNLFDVEVDWRPPSHPPDDRIGTR